MPPTHLTGLSVHSSTPAVLSTSLSHSLFLRKTWSPCYQVLSLFYSMQRQIQMQTRMQILMHKNKYKYKGIYKCWTQIASPKSACCQVLSLVSSACWSCWHLRQICTQKYTNTQIHIDRHTSAKTEIKPHIQRYKCKDRFMFLVILLPSTLSCAQRNAGGWQIYPQKKKPPYLSFQKLLL